MYEKLYHIQDFTIIYSYGTRQHAITIILYDQSVFFTASFNPIVCFACLFTCLYVYLFVYLREQRTGNFSNIYTQNISQPYSPEGNVNDKRDLYPIYFITMIGKLFYGGLHSKTRPPKFKFFEEKHRFLRLSPL